MDVQANVSGRDLGSVVTDVRNRLESVQFPVGYYADLLGEAAERAGAQRRMLLMSLVVAVGIFILLQASFGS